MKIYGFSQNKISWKNKILALALILILFFLAVNFFRRWQENRGINKEIANLKETVQNLEKGNLELAQLVEYFNSDVYIEEKARIDLGLKKPGEKIVVIPQSIKDGLADLNSQTENLKNDEKLTNPQKWWQYFFKE